MSDNKMVYRRLSETDLEHVILLHREVFGVEKTVAFLAWKYFQAGGLHSIFVVFDGDKMVGQSGGIPTRFLINSKEYAVMQEVDIVVSPAYQQSGVFFRVAKRSTAWDKEQKNLDYAFSIKKTYKLITRALKFKGVCPIFKQVKVIDPAPFLQRKIKSTLLSKLLGSIGRVFLKVRYGSKFLASPDLSLAEITEFDQRFDTLWKSIATDYPLMIIKDSQYLTWRYIKHPEIDYKVFTVTKAGKLKGAIVLSTAATAEDCLLRGNLIDLIVAKDDVETAETLLKQAITFFYQEKVVIITGWFQEHSVLYPLLSKYGFTQKKTQHDLTVRSMNPLVETSDLLDPLQWCVTMGDSDYF